MEKGRGILAPLWRPVSVGREVKIWLYLFDTIELLSEGSNSVRASRARGARGPKAGRTSVASSANPSSRGAIGRRETPVLRRAMGRRGDPERPLSPFIPGSLRFARDDDRGSSKPHPVPGDSIFSVIAAKPLRTRGFHRPNRTAANKSLAIRRNSCMLSVDRKILQSPRPAPGDALHTT
jgi:hypothetical protein